MIERMANSPKPDVQSDVGQEQVGAPVAAEVEGEGQQEDCRHVDSEVDRVVGIVGEHVGDSRFDPLLFTKSAGNRRSIRCRRPSANV